MIHRYRILLVLFTIILFSSQSLLAADWFSVTGGGDFHNLATWNSQADGLGTAPVSIAPADNFTIQAGHPVSIVAANPINITDLTIDGSLVTNDDLSLSGNLSVSGTGSYDLTTSVLNVAGTVTNSGTLIFSSGTVDYNGAGAQTVVSTTYGTLNLSGGGTKTAGGTLTITDLSNAVTFDLSTETLNIAGTISGAGTNTFSSGTVDYNGAGAQTVVSTTYGTLNLSGGGTKTAGGTITTTDLSNAVTFDLSTETLNVAGAISGAGTNTFSSGTVDYNGAGAQTVVSTTYGTLNLSGGGTKTAGGAITTTDLSNAVTFDLSTETLNVAGTISGAGTNTFSSGTVDYNGAGAQTVISTTYATLNLSGGGTKTAGGAITTTNLSNAVTFDLSTETLNIAGTISGVGTNTFSSGTVDYNGVGAQTVISTTYGTLNLSGGGTKTAGGTITTTDLSNAVTFDLSTETLNVAGAISGAGTNTFSSGTVDYNGTTAQNVIAGTYDNLVISGNSVKTQSGDVIVNQTLTIENTATLASATHAIQTNDFSVDNGGTFTGGSGAVTVANDLTVNGVTSGISGTLDIDGDLAVGATGDFTESSSLTNLAGNLTNEGVFSANGGTFTFDGATNSIIDGGTFNFNTLIVNKASASAEVEINDGGVTVNAATGLTITQGTFDFQTFSTAHSLGTVAGTANAVIAIAAPDAGTVTWPAGSTDLTSFVSTSGTTINYNTANSYTLPATLPGGGTAYQHVIFSGGGTKTATAALDVNGSFTINDATTFADGGFTHTVSGDWTENDASAQMTGTGTIEFDGGGDYDITTAAGGTLDFNNVTLSDNNTRIEHLTDPVNINGNVLINDGTTWNKGGVSINLYGTVWEELGTGRLTGGSNVIFFTAGAVIRGDAPIEINAIQVDNGIDLTLEQDVIVNGNVQLFNNAELDVRTHQLTGTIGNLTMSSGTLLRIGGGDNYPTAFNSITYTNGTVEYYLNGAQNVAGAGVVDGYNNLLFTGTGGKTAQADIVADFIDLDAGNLVSNGHNVTVTTDMDVESGATFTGGAGTVTISNDLLNDGTFTGGAGAIAITNNLDNNATFVQADGNLTVAGTFDNAATATFDGGAGTVQVTGNLTNNGDFDRGSGTITVSTGNFINAAGTFDGGTADIIVSTGTLTNDALLDVTTGGNITVTANTFTNSNGATFDGGAGTITAHTLTNEGDFDRGGGNITISTGDFTNTATGVFDDGVGSGDLTLSTGNIVNSGAIGFTGGNISTPGDFTNNNGASFTGGTGTVGIAGNLSTDGSFTGGAGAIDIEGNLVVGATGSFTESSTTTNLAGNLTSTGTFSANGGTFIFDGSTNSIIDGGTINFNNLEVNKTAPSIEVEINDGAVVLNAATALTITQGTFDFQEFDASAHSLGNVNGTANAIIAIAAVDGGNVVFPTGTTDMTNFTSTTGTTINYNTANSYTIPNVLPGGITTYQNIILSGGGTKTATAALDINGDITLNDATTFADGGFTHTVAGDWAENDAAAVMTGTGTIEFDGGGAQIISGTTLVEFNNFTTRNAGTSVQLNDQIEINSIAQLNDGTTLDQDGNTIQMRGTVWEEFGTGTRTGTGQTRFRNNSSVIRGDAPIVFHDIRVANAADVTLEQNIVVDDDLRVDDSCIFDAVTFTTTGGDDIQMNGNSLIRVSGASNFPSNFSVATFTTGTIEFYGNLDQDVPGTDVVTYFNLQSTGTGNKNAQNTISANFIDMNAGTLVSNGNAVSSTTDVDIEAGAGLDASAGGNVTVGNDVLNDGTFTGGAGTIAITRNLDNNAAFVQADGNMTVGGTFDNATVATFDGGAGTMQVTGDFTNNGDFDRGSGAITVTTGNFLNATTGTMDAGTADITITAGTATNDGALDVSTGGNITVTAGLFTNSNGATFDGGAGTIGVHSLTNAGDFDRGSGAMTVTTGNFSNTTTGVMDAGSADITVTVGSATNDGTLDVTGGGNISVPAATFTNSNGATFDGGAGTIGVHTLTNAGDFDRGSGAITVTTGDLTNAATGVFDDGTGSGNLTVSTGNVLNQGTMAFAGGDIMVTAGSFTNDAGADFDGGTGAMSIQTNLTNSGTFDGGSGDITVNIGLFANNAAGTYTGGTGALTVSLGTGTNDGVMTLAAGGDFTVGANSFTNGTAAQFTSGTGTVAIANDLINNATGAGFYNSNTPSGTTNIGNDLDNNGIFNALDATINIANDWLNSGTFGADNATVTIDENLTNETGGTLTPDASTFSFETAGDVSLTDVDENTAKFSFNVLQLDKTAFTDDVTLSQGTIIVANTTHFIAGSLDLENTNISGSAIASNHNLGNVTAENGTNAAVRLRLSAEEGTTCNFPDGDFSTTFSGHTAFLNTTNSIVRYDNTTNYTLPTIALCYKRLVVVEGDRGDDPGKDLSGDVCVDERFLIGEDIEGTEEGTTLFTNGHDITITGIASDSETDLLLDGSTLNLESGSTLTLTNGDMVNDNASELTIGDAANDATGATVLIQGADGSGYYAHDDGVLNMYGVSTFTINQTGSANDDAITADDGELTLHDFAVMDLLVGDFEFPDNQQNDVILNDNAHLILRGGDLEADVFTGNDNSQVTFQNQTANQFIDASGGVYRYTFANLTLKKAGFDLTLNADIRVNGNLELNVYDDDADATLNTTGGSVFLTDEDILFGADADILGENNVSFQDATTATAIASFDADRMFICNGTVNTGELIFEGAGTINTDFEGIYPIGAGTDADPLNYQYNYIDLQTLAASQDGVNVPTITVAVIPYPSGLDDVLNKYWTITTENIISVTQSELIFKYYDPAELSRSTGTLEVKRVDGGVEFNVPTGSVDEGAGTFTSGAANTFLETEWRMGDITNLPQTYYSFQDGDWDDPNTWTKDPFGLTQTAADLTELTARGSGPDNGDNVFIINGKTVNLTAAGKTVTLLALNDGELSITAGTQNAPTITGEANGVMRVTDDNFLPIGDYTDFVAADGGTIIFENNTATQLNNNNSRTGNRYNNVEFTGTGTGGIQMNNGSIFNGNVSFTENTVVEFRRDWDVFGDMFIGADAELRYEPGQTRTLDIYGDFTVEGTFTGSDKVAPDYTANPGAAIQVRFLGDDPATATMNGTTIFDELFINKNANETVVTFDADDPANTLFWSRRDANSDDEKAFEIIRGVLKLNSNIEVETLSEGGVEFIVEDNATLWINGAEVYATSADGLTDSQRGVEVQGRLRITSGFLDTRDSRGIWFEQDDDGEIEIAGGTLTTNALFTRNNSTSNDDSRGSLVISSGTLNIDGTGITTTGQFDAAASLFLGSVGSTFQMSGGTININGTSRDEFIIINADDLDLSVTGGAININDGTGSINVREGKPFYDLNFAASASLSVDLETDINITNDFNTGSGSTFDAAGFEVAIQGDWINDNGTFIPNNNTVVFNSDTDNQEVRGVSGFSSLQVDNSFSGGVVSISSLGANTDVTLGANLEVITGDLYLGKELIVNGNVTNNNTINGPRKLKLSGGASTHTISGDGTGFFRSIELDDANGAILAADMTLDATLLLTNGIFALDVHALNMNSGADIDEGGAGFDNTRMISTAGNASDGGINRTYPAAGNFTFPMGTDAIYTPTTITIAANSLASTFGDIRVSPVAARHPLATGTTNALTYYWDIEETGFSDITAAHSFTYDDTDIDGGDPSVDVNYVSGYYVSAWTQGTTADVDDANNTVNFSGLTAIAGAFTAGETTAFDPPQTFYSIGDGDWSNGGSWSLISHAGAAAGDFPQTGDVAIIGDNDQISVMLNDREAGAITIENGATLDIGTTTGHDFGTYTGVTGEEGELRVSASAANTTVAFPGGDWGAFLGDDGGTVEYYYSTAISANNSFMLLPADINTYYNLYIDNPNNDDDRRIWTNTQKLTIFNDMVFEDNTTLDNSWGEFYLRCDLAIGNDFRIEGASEIVVQNNAAHTLEIGGDFNMASNYGFYTMNGNAIHNIYLSGNMITNGQSNFDDSDARSTRITFQGNSNVSWTGGAAGITGFEATQVGQVVISFDDTTTVLSINDPKFDFTNLDIDYGGIYGTDQMNLDVQKGIVEVQNSANPFELRGSFELPSDGEIILNNPALTLETLGNFELAGVLRLVDGTINVGNGAGERLQPIVDGRARVEIEGGTLNVSGHISRSTVVTVGALDYRQSGGTVNVSTSGPNSSIRGTFEVLNDGSYFEMTGGTLVVARNNSNGTIIPGIFIQPTAYNVTGGTLVIGDATIGTPAETIEINSLVPLYNVRIDNGANNGHSLGLDDNPLIIQNDLEIETNTSLISNDHDLYVGGNFDNQGTYDFGTNKTFFNNTTGVGTQNLTASGTGALDFYDVEVVSQVTVQTVGSDMTVNNDLTINLGTLSDVGQRITVRNDIYNYDTHSSTGGGELLILNDDIQNIFSDGTGIFGNVRLDNANNVQLNSNIRIDGSLAFTNGNFLIQDHELTFGAAATVSGVGTDKMIVTDGLSSDGGVIKELNDGVPFSFPFPVGDGTIYTPALIQSVANPSTSGQIKVIRVADKHPATQDPLETQLNYYWKVSSTGLTGVTVTHQYTYDQSDVPVSFDETDGTAVVGRFDGSEWFEGATDVGSFNDVSNIIEIEPGGGAASFIDGDYTIGYDPEFDIVPRYRSLAANGTWTTAGDWEVFSPPSTWAVAATAPSSGEIITIQTGDVMTIPSGTSVLATSMEIETGSVLDLDETVGHDFTVLSGTGTLRLASASFPAGINSDFVSTGGGTIEYGQGSGDYTMPAIQSEYNNLIISTNGNTLNTSATDFIVNGDFTISTNATLDNSTNLSDISIPNGNWVNDGTYTPGTALLGAEPTVTFSSTTVNQSISGTSTSTFYNLVVDKAGFELETGANVSVDGDLTLTAGSINIDDDELTINGILSGAGTIKGANDATIVIGGTSGGSAGILNFEPGFNELGDFTVNRSGLDGSVTVGSDITVRSVTSMTAGEIILDGGTLTIDGTVAAGGTGSITGSCTGGLVLSDSDGDANALGGELRFTAGATELGIFTMNKPSTATLGSDLTVCTTFELTQGELVLSTDNTHTLTVNGTYSRTTGTLTGSANSNLTIDNGNSATADLVFTSNATALLNDFTLTKSAVGPGFSTSDPTDEMTISGIMTLDGSSVFDISGAKTLNLTGYTNGAGSLRGSTSTTLNIGGTTDDALGFLNFESGNRIVQNLAMNRTGGTNATAALGTDLEVDDTFSSTEGALELNDNSLTLSGSLIRTNGTITGSNGSDLTITGAPNDLGGEIHFTSGVTNGQRLRDFTMSKAGTAILGTDLTIRRNLTTTSGEIVLPSGTAAGTNTLTIIGDHNRESIGGSGTLTGSNESHIVIQGNGDLGDPLYFTSGAQFIQELDLDRQTNGLIELGTDLRIGETADTDGVLTMTNGEFVINGNTLTLVPSTSGYTRTNGTFTGSTDSRMVLDGTGNIGDNATNALFFTDDGADGQVLKDLSTTRSNGVVFLGTDVSIYDETNFEESTFAFGINGNTFTINGTPTSSGTVGMVQGDGDCASSSGTSSTDRSRFIIGSGQGSYSTRSLGDWAIVDQTNFAYLEINTDHPTDRTATLLSGTTINLCDTVNVVAGNFGLGGASGSENTIQIGGIGRSNVAEGVSSYVFTDANNTLVGNKFVNLTINGRQGSDDLGGGTADGLYFSQTGDGNYIKSFWLQRRATDFNTIGSVTLGNELNIGDESSMNGTFEFAGGELILNDQKLTMNIEEDGFESFPYSSGANAHKCLFRGSANSEMIINGPNEFNIDTDELIIFRYYSGTNYNSNTSLTTFPEINEYQTLRKFEINRTGDTGDDFVLLGSRLIVEDSLVLTKGVLGLSTVDDHANNDSLVIKGEVIRLDTDPTARYSATEGGVIRGNEDIAIIKVAGAGSTVNLYMDEGTAENRSLLTLDIERTSHPTVLRSELKILNTLQLDANTIFDIETNKTDAQFAADRIGLVMEGAVFAGTGELSGSYRSDILFNDSDVNHGTMNFVAGTEQLRSLEFTASTGSNSTVTIGDNLTIGTPTGDADAGLGFADLNGVMIFDGHGNLVLNSNILTFNSTANNFTQTGDGRFTGDYAADLILNGTGDLGSALSFATGAERLEILEIHRNAITDDVLLGTDLTVGDASETIPTGQVIVENGELQINGNHLTINNDYSYSNGQFRGSTTSDLTISGRGDAVALIFQTDAAGDYTLENFTVTRTQNDAGTTIDIDMGTDLIVGNSDDTDLLTIGDGAVLSLEGNHLTASGTLAFNTSGALRGSYTSDLTLTGLGTAMGTFRFRTDASTDNYINDFVLNRTNASGSATLGNDMNVGQPSSGGAPFDGTFALTNGAFVMNSNIVTINSTANNFSRGTNGSFTGDYSADLILNGSGDLGSTLFFTSGAEELEILEIHRDAITDDVVLGSNLTVGDAGNAIPSGQVIVENGELQINGNHLTINNDYSYSNGQFRGSTTSDLTISGRGEAAALLFQTTATTDYTLENLTITRSLNDAGTNIDIDMGTDIIVGDNDDTDILTVGASSVLSLEGNTLTLRGTANLNTSGRLRGSYTSDLVVEGTQNTNLGTLYFSTDAATDNFLNTFTMNRISGTSGAMTLGNSVNIGEPSGAGNQFNGEVTLTAGRVVMNGQSVTINSTANNYSSTTDGTFTGDNQADLILNGTGSLGSNLNFTTGSALLENLTVNRTSSGLVTLGTDLTMTDGNAQTGELLLNEGELALNGNTLTLSNGHARVNGNFIGSTSSNMLIDGQDDFDPLVFNTTTDANHTLLNLTISRTQNAAAAALDIDLGTDVIVGVSGSGELSLNAAGVVFSLEGNDLTVNGDLAEQDGTIRGVNTSSLNFGGTGVVTGTLKMTSGSRILDGLTMNRSGATAVLTMGTDLTLSGTNTVNSLTLTDGLITTTNTDLITLDETALVTGATYADGSGVAGLSGGSAASFIEGPIAKTFNANLGTFRFPVGKNGVFLESGVKDLNNFPTTFRSEYFPARHFDYLNVDNPSGVRRISWLEYWDISRTSGTSTAKVLAHWNAASQVTDPSTIFMAHYYNGANGTKWYGEGQSTNGGNATTGFQISANDLSSFSPVTHATSEETEVGNPLPITLLDFTATYVEGQGVKLDWNTASELNNKGFILKRSIGNPDNFETIADYNSHSELVGQGTTNAAFAYNTWDEEANLKPGEVHYYQLSQEDVDGTITTFKIQAVNIGGEVVLFQNYPNPATNQTTLSFATDKAGQATLAIYNTLGQLVEVIHEGQLDKGTHEFEHRLDQYKSGTYLIRLFFDSKVITKKMVVLK